MAAADERVPGQEVISQENLLLQAVERAGKVPDGRLALHFHLSQLRPSNRGEGHLRIALRTLEPLVSYYRGQMFLLSNNDIVVLLVDPAPEVLDKTVSRLRRLFGNDPLVYADTGEGQDRFLTVYDLQHDFREFFLKALELDDAQRRRKDSGGERRAPPPVDPRRLGAIVARLEETEVAPMIRRQSAVALGERKNAHVVFQEYFVAMAEVQRSLAPDVQVMGNRWLFQHLSQTLDRRVLTAMPRLAVSQPPPAISLNLNLSTLTTEAFRAFESWLGGRVGLVVEVQLVDVFADLASYTLARDWLQERGHRILLDGLSDLSVSLCDVGQFRADFYKIHWSPDLADGHGREALRAALEALGFERMVLGRCDSETAIRWGLDLGIRNFQGRFVDAMLTAVRMASCQYAHRCTLGQCTQRHAAVDQGGRSACFDKKTLDAYLPFRLPSARPAAGKGG